MLKFFQKNCEILAVMSERENGSMKIFAGTDLNLDNRAKFFQKWNINGEKVIAAEIVHGTEVEIVDENSERFIAGVDGLITKNKNIFLSVTIADCIPVFAYDSKAGIIGVAHCGWRGIVDGIIENFVVKILEAGGSTENIKFAMGPGINQCHFEIREDVLEKFKNYQEFIEKRNGKLFADLKGIIQKQLADCGVKLENIENNNECTMESKRYFSFRRDKPEKVEAMIAVIGKK